MTLPTPECEWGYTQDQLREILGSFFQPFMQWMHGQTMLICDGRQYNHDTQTYEPACGGVSHGVVVYSWDLNNYLAGGPITD